MVTLYKCLRCIPHRAVCGVCVRGRGAAFVPPFPWREGSLLACGVPPRRSGPPGGGRGEASARLLCVVPQSFTGVRPAPTTVAIERLLRSALDAVAGCSFADIRVFFTSWATGHRLQVQDPVKSHHYLESLRMRIAGARAVLRSFIGALRFAPRRSAWRGACATMVYHWVRARCRGRSSGGDSTRTESWCAGLERVAPGRSVAREALFAVIVRLEAPFRRELPARARSVCSDRSLAHCVCHGDEMGAPSVGLRGWRPRLGRRGARECMGTCG